MKRFAVILASIGLAGLLLPGQASALTFSPPTFDFSANPGDTLNDAVRLYNDGPEPVTLRIEALNFTSKAGDETSGVPEFYPADEVRDGHGLAPWITFINKEIVLQPGERGSAFFEIKVPSDAGPGSYFGAAVVTSVTPQAGQGVGVIGNTAILLLLKVNGDVVEKADLTSFTVSPKVSDSLPMKFEARIQNSGSVHLRPFGDIKIRDVFGRTVAVVPINRLEFKSVLPGGARRYSTEWIRKELPEGASTWERQVKNFAFGPYTAELSMEYGLRREVLTARARFWVFPWLAIAAGAAAIAAALLLIVGFFRWYRKRIIAQIERQKTQG
ncbi:MAG TPA: hypothetical protein VJ694_01910 [Patescibacteria group bacterium]|nr:hypothetical protein [Patescibacteria group bacterium]